MYSFLYCVAVDKYFSFLPSFFPRENPDISPTEWKKITHVFRTVLLRENRQRTAQATNFKPKFQNRD